MGAPHTRRCGAIASYTTMPTAEDHITSVRYDSLRVGDVFLRTINGQAVAVLVEDIAPDVRHAHRKRITGHVVHTTYIVESRFNVATMVSCIRGTP